jgi:archaemetzincin
MNGSNHLAETDAQPLHLCPICLRKLHSATNFDIVDRYKKLKSFSVTHGWTEQSKWLGRRLQRLTR